MTVCRLLRLNQYRNLTRKAEEKVYLRNDKKDPDRKSVKEMGLKSTLFWVSEVCEVREGLRFVKMFLCSAVV